VTGTPRVLVLIAVAGVTATGGARSADAADAGKPDPSQAPVVAVLRPDPAPAASFRQPVPQRTDAPAGSIPVEQPRAAVSPTPRAPAPSKRHEATPFATNPAFAAMLRRLRVVPTGGQPPPAADLAVSAAPARAPLLAAAAALAAVVLTSGSLLALASRRSLSTEA
jgi:hypothetical protein